MEGSDTKIVVKLDSHEDNDQEKLRSQSLNQEIKNRLERYVTLDKVGTRDRTDPRQILKEMDDMTFW